MNNFSVITDKTIIETGGFFCKACLVGKPAGEKSPNPRYCQDCYDFLLKEAELLPPKTKKPIWEPVPGRAEALPVIKEVVAKPADKGMALVGVLQHAGGRPKKEGKVHRTTEWRRKKVQGVLF